MLKILFAGTSDFAVPTLQALLTANYPIPLVITQPDRPQGRGLQLSASPIKQLALAKGLSVFQPENLKQSLAFLTKYSFDAVVVVSYGQMIPQFLLDHFPCFNVHASLLPRWRGSAPIQRAMLAGDQTTGITIMFISEKLDAGNVILRKEIPILSSDTAKTLHDKLAQLGAIGMLEVLERKESLAQEIQDEHLAIYAKKIEKSEGLLDWNDTAESLVLKIRIFNPFPIARLSFKGESHKIFSAEIIKDRVGQVGEILTISPNFIVACGRDALNIKVLQRSGGKKLLTQDFLRGSTLQVGDFLV